MGLGSSKMLRRVRFPLENTNKPAWFAPGGGKSEVSFQAFAETFGTHLPRTTELSADFPANSASPAVLERCVPKATEKA